jgi:dihydropteroate synthase
MSSDIYLRPLGRITKPPGLINAAPDKVVRLSDREDVVFAALELIQRHGDGWSDRRVVSPEDARALMAQPGPLGARCKTLMARLAAPRGPIAGLALDKPRIMGIVNVTPDSFSDAGRFASTEAAIDLALQLEEEGADILDIGGESTRPGADPVPAADELRRVMPVIEGLVGRVRARLSIDTRKAEVMRRAALAGVHILNDISALQHDAMSLRVAAETRLPVILMHAQGDPQTMQRDPQYNNVLLDVYDMLEARVEACVRAGIARERLIVDPGIGFGKTAQHNLELLAGLSLFHSLGTAVLLGASRKSFIGALSGAVDPAERVPGSVAAGLSGIMQGAQILRVHDVAATRQALTIWQAAVNGSAAGTASIKPPFTP